LADGLVELLQEILVDFLVRIWSFVRCCLRNCTALAKIDDAVNAQVLVAVLLANLVIYAKINKF